MFFVRVTGGVKWNTDFLLCTGASLVRLSIIELYTPIASAISLAFNWQQVFQCNFPRRTKKLSNDPIIVVLARKEYCLVHIPKMRQTIWNFHLFTLEQDVDSNERTYIHFISFHEHESSWMLLLCRIDLHAKLIHCSIWCIFFIHQYTSVHI